MERLLTGLVDFSIKKVISVRPARLEVVYNKRHHVLNVGVLRNESKRVSGERLTVLPNKGIPSHSLFIAINIIANNAVDILIRE